MRRWLYVARMASPHERADIAHAAACVVQEHTGHVAMYRETMALSGDDAGVDTAWCEATEARALAIRERLSAALARCQSHLLSDELRMRTLFHYASVFHHHDHVRIPDG